MPTCPSGTSHAEQDPELAAAIAASLAEGSPMDEYAAVLGASWREAVVRVEAVEDEDAALQRALALSRQQPRQQALLDGGSAGAPIELSDDDDEGTTDVEEVEEKFEVLDATATAKLQTAGPTAEEVRAARLAALAGNNPHQ